VSAFDSSAGSVLALEGFGLLVPSSRLQSFVLEARLRRSAIKDGVMTDQFQYAFIVDGDPPPGGSRG